MIKYAPFFIKTTPSMHVRTYINVHNVIIDVNFTEYLPSCKYVCMYALTKVKVPVKKIHNIL